MLTLIRYLLIHFTYVALIAFLIAAGFGAPIPEDIPLAFSGYLCNAEHGPIPPVIELIDTDHDGVPDAQLTTHHVPHVSIMILAGMIGVLAGDTMVYYVGRRGIDSNTLIARHVRKVLNSKRRERAERHFHRHGGFTVFAGRFLPGLRSPIFALAGMSRMSYLRFILIDGFAALISVPTFILLGNHFAENINQLFFQIHRIKESFVTVSIGLVIMAVIIVFLRQRRRSSGARAVIRQTVHS